MTDHSELLSEIKGLSETDETVNVRESFGLMSAKNLDVRSLRRVIDMVTSMEKMQLEGGTQKWFSADSPWPISELPKHKAFFDAGLYYDERLAMAANRVGKAQPNTEPVLTPYGWVPMGELQAGDEVVGSNGKAVKVLAVHPQGVRPVYEVVTSDGSKTLCDPEHLWNVRNTSQGKAGEYATLTTKEIATSDCRWILPARPSVQFAEKDLPIDPYLLGLLIGDGGMSTRTIMFTTMDEELVDYCTKIAPEYSCELIKRGNMAYHFASKRNNAHGKNYNLLFDLIQGLGLNCTSHHKRIPEEYMWSSEEHRISLLQGLVDTDGYVGKNGQVTYYSVSKALCEDVAALVRSLGVNASVVPKKGRYKNEIHWSYAVHIRKTEKFVPVRLARKLARVAAPAVSERGLTITSVNFMGYAESTCITVDAEDQLYMANDYLVTHNSIMGCFETVSHLTGDYPDWWIGRMFEDAIDAWAIGPDARAVRDTIQRELMGPLGEWGTGMIPAHLIGKYSALQGTPGAIDQLQVKHKSGKWSRLGFKNYQQDIKSFMGTSRHLVWCDEEVPMDIYNECLIRTATTGGIMITTFTPLEGLTPMVVNFCKDADFLLGAKPVVSMDSTSDDDNMDMVEESQAVGKHKFKAVLQLGWDDAPWLDERTKQKFMEGTPVHLRDARSKGLPAMGAGNVYAVPLEEILVDPFSIPDAWPRMYGFDVGWNRTAASWAALDPVTDTLYIYDEHYLAESMPPVHAYAIKSRGDWIQGAIDPASRGRSQTDGNKLFRNYRDLDLHIFLAKNEFEAGTLAVSQRLVARKLKIFKTCINLQKEYLLYRRDKNGKIIKENDHLLDTVRYIVLNLNRMSSKSDYSKARTLNYRPTIYNI